MQINLSVYYELHLHFTTTTAANTTATTTIIITTAATTTDKLTVRNRRLVSISIYAT